LVIGFQYDDANNFKHGIAKVTKDGETFGIDKSGRRSDDVYTQRNELTLEEFEELLRQIPSPASIPYAENEKALIVAFISGYQTWWLRLQDSVIGSIYLTSPSGKLSNDEGLREAWYKGLNAAYQEFIDILTPASEKP